MFAADLGGKLAGLPVNFVDVRLENQSAEPRTAFFSSAYRYSPPVYRLGGGRADFRFRPALRPDSQAIQRRPDAVQCQLAILFRAPAR